MKAALVHVALGITINSWISTLSYLVPPTSPNVSFQGSVLCKQLYLTTSCITAGSY